MKRNISVEMNTSGHLPDITYDYVQDKKLKKFYGKSFKIENFKNQIIDKRNFSDEKRKILVEVLKDQNKDYQHLKAFNDIGLLLKKNCYTVTTGHQLSLFTGPLFFIYKIIQVIKICDELKDNYSNYNFIPVFWMASEDHDFEEIRSFNSYEKTFLYDYSHKNFCTGKIKTLQMSSLYQELKTFFKGKPNEKALLDVFNKSYKKETNFSDSTRSLVYQLFKDYNIIVLDPDDHRLKISFKEIALDELKNFSSHKIVNNTIKNIKNSFTKKVKIQVNPRILNLFYITKSKRYRIEYKEGKYALIGKNKTFKKDEFINHIESNPNRISPNVILRPLYQETVLPNLAYVGGGSEISYWLELNDLFNFYSLPFPILAVRKSLLLISKRDFEKIDNLNLKIQDFFLKKDQLVRKFLKSTDDYNFSLKNTLDSYSKNSDQLKDELSAIDNSLVSVLESLITRHRKDYNSLEKKVIKTIKLKNSQKLKSLEKIYNRIYPNGIPQERFLNFSHFYSIHGQEFIDFIFNVIQPFDSRLQVCEI